MYSFIIISDEPLNINYLLQQFSLCSKLELQYPQDAHLLFLIIYKFKFQVKI